ncbi:MAG: hypothetical protein M1818_005488 [Claussenomyces sp. TS43310]|nr:MAG: hypothetical protein M1818_005488 [Claussenomyces sp. TS43310]
MTPSKLCRAIEGIHYTFLSLTILYFLTASTISACTLQTLSPKREHQKSRRKTIIWLMSLVVGTYVVQALLYLIESLVAAGGRAFQYENVYNISMVLVWGIQTITLAETDYPVWYPYYGNWIVGIIFEVTLIVLSNIFRPPQGAVDLMVLSLQALRICFLLAMPFAYIFFNDVVKNLSGDTERQSLLGKLAPAHLGIASESSPAEGYGGTTSVSVASSTTQNPDEEEEEDWYVKKIREDKERMAKRLKENGNWWTYSKGFLIFFPYIWPFHNRMMQSRAAAIVLCLMATNALHVLIPRQLGLVTDALINRNGHASWVNAVIYVTLSFANSGGCIGWLQFWLWLPLEKYGSERLTTVAHAHVMDLSCDFHDNTNSSDIHIAVERGTSITELVELVSFRILPMFADLCLAVAYLYYLFGAYMGLNIIFTSIIYVYTTTKLISMATATRRKYMTHNRKQWKMGFASIDNWQNATYFDNISHEQHQFSSSVKDHVKSQGDYQLAVRLVSAAQGFVLTAGLLCGCFLAIYQVIYGSKTAGDFVTLLTYWAQLRGPLAFFSDTYKTISSMLMDAELLLELFQKQASVTDKKEAKPLKFDGGEVKFENVNFAYDPRRLAIKNLNFSVPAGYTVALVGETGSGKSTILKLIDRFYDVSGGRITIDGQDLRDVTMKSLRQSIGVVPQDATMFNESIMSNIRYAKLDATEKEVFEACRAASIHDKIMAFPDGYNSKVGPRGMKLSGGERQRLAIARAILKQPELILLDEATSAVDTETEQMIQDALRILCGGRTTFIVAHRLSTIMKANLIMVVKDGEIIEQGSHDKLIRAQGKYWNLWSKQIMVKVSKSRSGSESSHQTEDGFINDLESDCHNAEMSKGLEAAPCENTRQTNES